MGRDDYNESIGVEHPDLLKSLNTIAVGKYEIQEYEVESIEGLQTRPDSGFNNNLIAERLQGLPDDPGNTFIVVNDKNPFIHG